MHKIDYCQGRLIRTFLLFTGGGLISALVVPSDLLVLQVVTVVLFGCGGLVGLKAFGDRSALIWDQRGITLITLTGRNSVDWREVQDIGAQRLTQYMFGFIPVSHMDFLTIKTRGGLLASKRYRVNASLLELPPGGSCAVAETLIRAHAAVTAGAAVPVAEAQPRPAPVREIESAEESGLDHDAAIARYLARKAAEQASMPEGPVAAPVPARPVFGRKAV
jgi:hypothetical protein